MLREIEPATKIFQPTLPARGATDAASCRRTFVYIFQPTLPARGATGRRRQKVVGRADFNPRSPHGERPGVHPAAPLTACISTHAPRTGSDITDAITTRDDPISTHAPRTGSDDGAGAGTAAHILISTHAPRTGSDAMLDAHRFVDAQFQPTLPARGATNQAGLVPPAERISTHAPRTGSDRGNGARGCHLRHFNPRSPHGERLRPTHPGKSTCCISTHAPRTGSDAGRRTVQPGERISTHAPRTGSDRGEGKLTGTQLERFQPTLPARGATTSAPALSVSSAFQPTLPARGATRRTATHKCRRERFQPTLPARGATVRRHQSLPRQGISTHAPRTGSDATSPRRSRPTSNFNPRSPHGERPVPRNAEVPAQ